MKNIEFKDKSAQLIYNNYLKRIERATAVLAKSDKTDILMEINSHIYEGIISEKENTNEVENLTKIIDGLGDPEVVLKPLIADKKLKQATSTFNPKHVFQALALNIRNGFEYAIFALLYISIFGFGFLMILKLMHPEDTGLFLQDGKFRALGRLQTTENYTEVLGDWFIPTVFISAILLYIILTLILKRKRKKNLPIYIA